MKLQSLLLLVCLIAHASAIVIHYYSYYGNQGDFVVGSASIRDHKAQGLVDGLSRWSSGRFTAYRGGDAVIVYNLQIAASEQTARRLLGEMNSMVAHFAADG